ncbi:hypothetical protein [Nodularia spumigena]
MVIGHWSLVIGHWSLGGYCLLPTPPTPPTPPHSLLPTPYSLVKIKLYT